MSLISLDFALFLLVVLPLNWVLRPVRPVYRVFLLASCYFFYGSLSLHFLTILVHFTAWTWVLGLGIGYAEKPWLRKTFLCAHIGIGVGGLVLLKYYDLLFESVGHLFVQAGVKPFMPELDIAVPVGVSFFTFQGLSYTIDVFRSPDRMVKNPLDLSIFIAFFPTILSGPIMRAGDFIPQIGNMRCDPQSCGRAFSLILTGLAKKLVLSAYLSEHVVQPVFENPGDFTSLCAALGIFAYSVQILCDFSGYTDLVRGIAMLLGYSVPENFDKPYSARNLAEFWRRWHMSLSRWLRDYLYISLGGNRRGRFRKYLNILITMTLGGLWHGASWNFLIWGVFHGIGVMGSHIFADLKSRFGITRGGDRPGGFPAALRKSVGDVLSLAGTFLFVSIGWVFFRAKSLDQALALLQRVVVFDLGGRVFSEYIAVIVLVIVLAVLALEVLRLRPAEVFESFLNGLHPVFQAAVIGFLVMVLLRLAPDGVPQFIYYQF